MSNQKRFALLKQHEIGTALWDEGAQDAVGSILTDSAEINFTYTDATPSITAALINASIVFARLQDADAVSVLGRSANSAGVLDEIAAAANDRLLRRTSDALNFGQLTAGMFPNTVVPDAALSANVPLLNAANSFSAIQTINIDGTAAPANSVNADARLVIVDNEATSIQQLKIGTGSQGFRFIAAGGTFGTPTAVDTTNSSYIGYMGGGGYDGTNWQTPSAGLFGIRPGGTWSGTSRPTDITIETTAVSSTTRVERVRVKNLGQVRFVPLAADPGTLEDGDVWYNSTDDKLRVRANGATVDLH